MKKIFFLLMFPFFLKAQKNYAPLLDHYMQAAVKVNQFTGSVLIAKGGNIIYQKTFGTIDYANTKLLDSNSMFEIGKITEGFTAAGILLLRDKGKLTLDDKITKYFPELPYSNVTIKHLLTHTSGVPDYFDALMHGKWDTGKLATFADIIQRMAAAKIPLAWKPGEKWDGQYYYTEFPLLGDIIEKISGQTYADFMQEKIFTPLHLQHTKVFVELQVNKKYHPNHTESVYYDESKQQFFQAGSFNAFGAEYPYATQGIVGGNGISSTAHDLFLWNQALQHHTLLPPSTQTEMLAPHTLEDTLNKIFFGYGIETGKNVFGNYVRQFDGGNNETLGYLASTIHYTTDDITIIILANKAKSTSSVSGPLAYILFDREVILPYVHTAVSIDILLLDKYVGKYGFPGINVYKKEGTLWRTNSGEPDMKLLPESATKFFSASKEYDFQIQFETDDKGDVVKTYFIFGGLKTELKKL
jgi:CubicO group peptidase (beta-lactamase class C family)